MMMVTVYQIVRMMMMIMMAYSMLLMMMMTMTVTISLIQKMPMMMVTVYQIVRMMMMIMMAWKMKEKMMMMMMLELAPTPSDLVTELPGDLSSLSLRPSFCSSAIENQRRFSTRKDKLKKRRMAKPKSQLFQRNQSPCRHSIMNQTNSLDSPGLTLMYLTNHCTK